MALPVVPPILPVLSTTLPRGRDWVYELKYDGFRGVLYIDDGKSWFRSKPGNVMRRFAGLAEAVAGELEVKSAILDGEIVTLDEAGRPQFMELMRNRGVPRFGAFDLMWLNGRDLREQSLTKRKTAMRRLLGRVDASSVFLIESHRERGLYQAVVEADLEGVVAKRRGDPYAPESEWIKVRNPNYSQKEGRAELFHRKR